MTKKTTTLGRWSTRVIAIQVLNLTVWVAGSVAAAVSGDVGYMWIALALAAGSAGLIVFFIVLRRRPQFDAEQEVELFPPTLRHPPSDRFGPAPRPTLRHPPDNPPAATPRR
jgi:hypothetical protein